MPPKKKNKYANANANARGFATTSTTKAKPVEEPQPEAELEPEPVFETPLPVQPEGDQSAVDDAAAQENGGAEDEYVTLADRIENVTLRRVDAFLGQAQKVNVEALPVLKMESKLENNVVSLLKQAEAKDAGKFCTTGCWDASSDC